MIYIVFLTQWIDRIWIKNKLCVFNWSTINQEDFLCQREKKRRNCSYSWRKALKIKKKKEKLCTKFWTSFWRSLRNEIRMPNEWYLYFVLYITISISTKTPIFFISIFNVSDTVWRAIHVFANLIFIIILQGKSCGYLFYREIWHLAQDPQLVLGRARTRIQEEWLQNLGLSH